MPEVHAQRMTAEVEGDFVIFLIGMRITKPWKVHKWWPVFRAMRPMLQGALRPPRVQLPGLYLRLAGDRPILALLRAPRSLRT